MHRFISGLLPACAIALLAGCAGTPQDVQWTMVSVRDQHLFLPQVMNDRMRPTVVVTSGPTGLVVGTGDPAPATRMLAENGQLRLVSEATYARMQQQGAGGTTMGGSAAPAAPAPSR